eukprot:4876309-Amphidinium_carterae.2
MANVEVGSSLTPTLCTHLPSAEVKALHPEIALLAFTPILHTPNHSQPEPKAVVPFVSVI